MGRKKDSKAWDQGTILVFELLQIRIFKLVQYLSESFIIFLELFRTLNKGPKIVGWLGHMPA